MSPKVKLAGVTASLVMTGTLPTMAKPQLASKSYEAVPLVQNQLSPPLRAFGKVNYSSYSFKEKGGAVVLVNVFEAQSPKEASTVLGKFLADLNLSPGVTTGNLKVGGQDFPLVTVAGGNVYTGAILASTAYVVSAPSAASLTTFLGTSPVFVSAGLKTQSGAYPTYLDRFDRYGWGFYGLGGVSNYHNWKGLPGGSPDADPLQDLEFLAKNGFRFDQWLDPAVFDNSHKIPYQPEIAWMTKEAKKRNLPYSVRLYGELPHSWEYGDAYEKPADFLETGWYNGAWQSRTWQHQSWYHQRGQHFLAWQAQQQINNFKNDDSLQSWMLPIGEIGPDTWYGLNGDFSPAATRAWRDHLQKNGVTLEQASVMYGRPDSPFASWDQVPAPEFATLVGLPGLVKDLGGDWYCRWEDPAKADKWWNADVQTPDWKVIQKPGSETWFNTDQKRGVPKWCIREFELPSTKFDAEKPLYLYLYLRPSDSGRVNLHTPVYVNGEPAGEVGRWGALDVSKFIKAGQNRVAVKTDTFGGRVFLSREKPAVYPYMGPDRNRMWRLFRDFQLNGPYKLAETVLAGMRQADPDKPIKMMAPIGMGTDRWMDLATRFGAWPHFTGEGMWYFPWYKRYAYLYGVPGTSEGGGPSDNVTEQEDLFQRVFLAGLDSHDQVFMAQQVTKRPDVKEWFDKHIATLKQLGRYDISGPQVLIYRSTNAQQYNMVEPYPAGGTNNEEVQDAWNWDIGRGTLQTIGQSYLYVDDGGVRDGKLNGYDILVDGGNETVNPKSLSGIEDWVRGGGTFVTWPFSGRSSLEQPDSWPIKALTGCEITKREAGQGSITIGKDQTLLKELAGKTFPDAGKSVDWQKNNHNKLSLELKPGPGAQVIARFENGSPAIVVRPLGAGKVVVLGSAFFRDAQDIRGIWWPGESETTFFRDLLNGLGQPSVNVTSDSKVWAQRYTMKNGLDEVVTLVSFADAEKKINVFAHLDRRPVSVYEVGLNSIKEVPFTVQPGSATGYNVTIKDRNIGRKEVQLYMFRSNAPAGAARHWWDYQQKYWTQPEKMAVDLSDVGHGRWGGYAKSLADDWRWTQESVDNWTSVKLDDSSWKPGQLGIFNYEGADPNKIIYLRRHFQVPADWLKSGGTTKVVQGAYVGQVFPGSWKAGGQVYLNGQLVSDWWQGDYFEKDISRLLNDGDNVLSLAVKRGDSQFLGVMGLTYLTHSEQPAQRLPLKFTVTDGKTKYRLPGTAPKTAYALSQKVFIPAEWKDKYHVVFYMAGERTSIVGVYLNEKLKRRFHHWYGNNAEIDLTPYLKFGQDNLIRPERAGDVEWNLSNLELRLYPRNEQP